MKCCWMAFERRGGWRLEFAREGRPDAKFEGVLFGSPEEIKQALKAEIVFVEMGTSRRKAKGELSVNAQNIMRNYNLTPEKIRKLNNNSLLALRNCGVVTLNEFRNHFGEA